MIFSITRSILQIGMGTTTPDASFSIDIYSTNSGVLISSVDLTNILGTVTIATQATSLLVYDTNTAKNFGSCVGYYFWKGIQWEKPQNHSVDNCSRSTTGILFPKTMSDNIGIRTK